VIKLAASCHEDKKYKVERVLHALALKYVQTMLMIVLALACSEISYLLARCHTRKKKVKNIKCFVQNY